MTTPAPLDLPAVLDDLERAHAAASRAPWGLVGGTHDRDLIDDHGCHVATSGTFPDAALIVAAANAVPTLIAELRKRDAALRAVEAECDALDRDADGADDFARDWKRLPEGRDRLRALADERRAAADRLRAAITAALSPESVSS